MELVGLLTEFHLTRQEAAIYMCLLAEGDMNGYEVAKVTGISRSNSYSSLASLVEKGAANVIEGDAVKYTPVPISEFCENKIRNLNKIKDTIVEQAPEKRKETEGYITIKGKNHILDKMKNMISKAEKRIYISSSDETLREVLPEMKKAAGKGIKIVLITEKTFKFEGSTVYYSDEFNKQIRLITDSENVLTGEIDKGDYSTCLFSKKKNLVDLLKESLKNEIKLIELMKGENQ